MNKIVIFRDMKGSKPIFQLRISIDDPVYGVISLFSEIYSSITEADCRCVALAKILPLDREHIPVHDEPISYLDRSK